MPSKTYFRAPGLQKTAGNAALIENPPPGAPVPPILPPQDGYLFLDKAKFAASFAADVGADTAEFMADSQVPWGVEALSGAISQPAWKTKPSCYLVSTEDRMIPPDAQRAMSKRAGSTVVEVKGSHAVYVSQPQVGSAFQVGLSCAKLVAKRRNKACDFFAPSLFCSPALRF